MTSRLLVDESGTICKHKGRGREFSGFSIINEVSPQISMISLHLYLFER